MKKKSFLIFISIPVIIAVAMPFINRYYLAPRKWKEHIYNGTKIKYPDIQDNKIEKFTECLYEKFLNKYQSVANFPTSNKYGREEFKFIGLCTFENIVDSDSVREFGIKNIEELTDSLFIKE